MVSLDIENTSCNSVSYASIDFRVTRVLELTTGKTMATEMPETQKCKVYPRAITVSLD